VFSTIGEELGGEFTIVIKQAQITYREFVMVKNEIESILDLDATSDDTGFEKSLRPDSLGDFQTNQSEI